MWIKAKNKSGRLCLVNLKQSQNIFWESEEKLIYAIFPDDGDNGNKDWGNCIRIKECKTSEDAEEFLNDLYDKLIQSDRK